MPDAGKWIAQDRGSLEVEAVQEFEAIPPATFPLAERIPAPQLVSLFILRDRLPQMKNGLPAEANSPQVFVGAGVLPGSVVFQDVAQEFPERD
jgi:hypothetical protein